MFDLQGYNSDNEYSSSSSATGNSSDGLVEENLVVELAEFEVLGGTCLSYKWYTGDWDDVVDVKFIFIYYFSFDIPVF